MTAPLFHLRPGALDGVLPGSAVTLGGPEGHHAANVMRLGLGEQIQLSDTRQITVTGTVTGVSPGELSVEVHQVHTEPVQLPRLLLVQALAKDKRDLQAVESATELGVDAIIPWQAERSVARWKAGREAKKHAEWSTTVAAAAKQTRRTAVPQVHPLHTSRQYLELIGQQPGIGVVVLHETDTVPLAETLAHYDAAEELHLVVGPEGGISQNEIEQFTAAGARTARLGRHVLRSSTAGPAALAAVQVLLGRWGSHAPGEA